MVRIGIAMLQGARHEHHEAIKNAAFEMNETVEVIELRKASQLDGTIDGLILPGGESTTMRIASKSEALLDGIFKWMIDFPNKPVLGTCAGAIILANPGGKRKPFIEVEIARNAWGRLRFSFEASVKVSILTPEIRQQANLELSRDRFNHKPLPMTNNLLSKTSDLFPGVFIRAPRFGTHSNDCVVVATLEAETVGVLQNNKLALTFHPELTSDRRFHRWLISQIINKNS